ncbi:hypothetical protein B0H10DRAFT_1948407 [Mycena sp. CBHHK59/15]|nr:hypothetical protein B0H10DRAFT_1948407 [Mycena sp. CBHHK59/15]
MPKHKATVVSIEDDGSGSDDSQEDYAPRRGFHCVDHIPDETISRANDGRIRSMLTMVPIPASPSKKSQAVLNPDLDPPPEPASHEGWQEDFSEFDTEYGPGLQEGPREPRPLDNPNEQWVRLDREDFLDELIRHDGRGDHIHQQFCAGEGCKVTNTLYRCKDCLYSCLYCKECVVSMHRRMPLHHIEIWDGQFFKRCTLKSLGL